jgi:hypothetical protein
MPASHRDSSTTHATHASDGRRRCVGSFGDALPPLVLARHVAMESLQRLARVVLAASATAPRRYPSSYHHHKQSRRRRSPAEHLVNSQTHCSGCICRVTTVDTLPANRPTRTSARPRDVTVVEWSRAAPLRCQRMALKKKTVACNMLHARPSRCTACCEPMFSHLHLPVHT